MTLPPYRVIGRYVPPRWRASVIGIDLTGMTEDLGFIPFVDPVIKQNRGAAWYSEKLHAEVRMTAVPGSEGTSWHQDGDTSPGANMDMGIILWSNRWPTQFILENKIYQAKPFDLIIARNLKGRHRRPPEAEGRRWSFRQRVTI